MKLNHPAIVKTGMLLASGALHALHATMDIRFVVDDPRADPLRAEERNIYAFWHEMLILPAYTHVRFATALISRHRDGDIIATAVRLLRGRSIRGSTTRGGVVALRRMLREGQVRHLVITPDGPRGPRRAVQQGAAFLASRTGMPIVPVGLAYSRCLRAKSWDRMAVPLPMARARVVGAAPLCVPPDADREALVEATGRIQRAMDEAQARAEALAATEHTPNGDALIAFGRFLRQPD